MGVGAWQRQICICSCARPSDSGGQDQAAVPGAGTHILTLIAYSPDQGVEWGLCRELGTPKMCHSISRSQMAAWSLWFVWSSACLAPAGVLLFVPLFCSIPRCFCCRGQGKGAGNVANEIKLETDLPELSQPICQQLALEQQEELGRSSGPWSVAPVPALESSVAAPTYLLSPPQRLETCSCRGRGFT